MSLFNVLIRNLGLLTRRRGQAGRPSGRRPTPRLRLESLEPRCLLSYSVTDLGTLGGPTSAALAINSAGQVVGTADLDATHAHAFLYNGALTDLGTLGGANSSAHGINSAGQVAGSSEINAAGDTHAFVWDSAGGLHDLGTLGGADSEAHTSTEAGPGAAV